jgi:DNA topoisomerase-3
LIITDRGYLEVYPYDRWSDKELRHYDQGDEFVPSEIDIHEGSTTAPPLLTEADLIALMEKHGIGEDLWVLFFTSDFLTAFSVSAFQR